MRKFLIVFFFLFPLQAGAQNYDDSLSHHQLGIAASTISGYGLTYSYIFNKDFRIKSVMFAYYEDQGYSNAYNWTGQIGLELQYTLESSSMTRFYALLGGTYYHYENHNSDTYYSTGPDSLGNYFSTPYNSVTSQNTITVGFGVGFEVLLWRHLAINLDIGFEYDHTKNLTENDPNVPSNYYYYYYYGDNYIRKYFSMAGGAGIGYRF